MLDALRGIVSKFFSAVGKETDALAELHQASQAVILRLEREDPGFTALIEKAHAYAIFPSVGKATAVIGGAFGKGEVFEKGSLIGYAGVVQLTLGVQLGGQTFTQVILFENKQALDRFKRGRFAFAANASAVLVKAGAAGTANYESGVAVYVYAEGGLMLEAAIGGQKFFFKPAVLGRTRKAEPGRTRATTSRPKPKPTSRRRPSRAGVTSKRAKTAKRSTKPASSRRRRAAGRG
jgi:lipid-binding SYLF domain-containing protein